MTPALIRSQPMTPAVNPRKVEPRPAIVMSAWHFTFTDLFTVGSSTRIVSQGRAELWAKYPLRDLRHAATAVLCGPEPPVGERMPRCVDELAVLTMQHTEGTGYGPPHGIHDELDDVRRERVAICRSMQPWAEPCSGVYELDLLTHFPRLPRRSCRSARLSLARGGHEEDCGSEEVGERCVRKVHGFVRFDVQVQKRANESECEHVELPWLVRLLQRLVRQHTGGQSDRGY